MIVDPSLSLSWRWRVYVSAVLVMFRGEAIADLVRAERRSEKAISQFANHR
jgi:hypothetical protein